MPSYEYYCECNDKIYEIIHSIKDESPQLCPICQLPMKRKISRGFYMAKCNLKPTLEDLKETSHTKKVKDLDRAIKSRRKAFGADEVPIPVDKPDSKHVFKKGKVLAKHQQDFDKQNFIKEAAKSDKIVKKCQEALKK